MLKIAQSRGKDVLVITPFQPREAAEGATEDTRFLGLAHISDRVSGRLAVTVESRGHLLRNKDRFPLRPAKFIGLGHKNG